MTVKSKMKWAVVSGLMALSLVLVSCGQADVEETKGPGISVTTEEKELEEQRQEQEEEEVEEEEVAGPSGPQYGGIITYRLANDPSSFDSGTHTNSGYLINTVYQQYMGSDWLRGPAGGGATNYAAGAGSVEDSYGPQLAESWETPEQGVWVLKIREGVHWQLVDSEAGRLMGGREMTVDDIVSSFNRLNTAPGSWIAAGQPRVAESATAEITGDWEVTIKTPVDYFTAFVWLIQGAGFARVYPPEVVEKYGDMSNWQNAVGTGPFMLVDYVQASQFTFVKNPNYWETDPVGPGKGNQLPYVDGIKELIIPDISTTLAALRTGKLDLQESINLEDGQTVISITPEIESDKYLSALVWGIGMKQDEPEQPFSDVRVRQALMLATDFESIKRDYFGGEAEIDIYPINFQTTSLYEPLDEMPEVVQELFSYNPDKAKQLLADAGYPDGFSTSIVVSSDPARVDELAIYKEMWSKVGIDLKIEVLEMGNYLRIAGARREWDNMLYRTVSLSFNFQMYHAPYRGAAILNPSRINNPPGADTYLEDIHNAMNENMFINMPAVYEEWKKVKPYILEQAFVIPRPQPYQYTFWWPWLKNYYGQGLALTRYAWIDQDLKKEMGY
ncbi:MAG: ABC transporter substrate-binding protein [Dehalococcoidales bacterium]